MDTDYCLVQQQAGGKGRATHCPATCKAKPTFWCEQLNSQTPGTQGLGMATLRAPSQAPSPVLDQTTDVFPKLGRAIGTGALLGLKIPAGLSPLKIKGPALVPKAGDEGSMWAGAMQPQTRCLYFSLWLTDPYPAGIEKSFRKHNIQFPFHLRDTSQA